MSECRFFRLVIVLHMLLHGGCSISTDQSRQTESTPELTKGAFTQEDNLRWEAEEVVRVLYEEPHLLVRLRLTGTHFPQRAIEPFVVVGTVRSRFVEIADDGLSANAYFDKPLPQEGLVAFGYGKQILLRFPEPFDRDTVKRLN